MYILPALVRFVEVLLLRFGGSALVDLGGLTAEPTELAVLFPLWGGMGTGPLGTIGASGSIALGLGSLDSTEKMKHNVQKDSHKQSYSTHDILHMQ